MTMSASCPNSPPPLRHAATRTATTSKFAPASLAASGTCSAASRILGFGATSGGSALRIDDQRGHHAEHPVLGFGVGKNVAVERPGSFVVAVHHHVPALAG